MPVDHSECFKNDHLKFENSIKKLATIFSIIHPPFTIAVYGKWGTGKTSYMKLLLSQLESDQFETFWFNAWEYEDESSILVPLLSKLSGKIKKESEVKKSIKRICAATLLSGASIALKLATLKMSELDDVKKSFELYEEKTGEFYEKWISNIDDLKEEFKKMVFEICGEKKLVIFIDDLDRCSPGNAVKLLEDIKHFLAINNSKCIFVIGVDKYALTAAINIKYGVNSINTDEYLEKIINLSIAVPKINSATYKKYIIETIKQQTTSGWYTTLTTDIELFANILSSVDCSNPRRTKMVINRYLLYLGMYDKKKLFTEIIIKLIICREFFPLAYRVREISNIVNYFPQTRKGNHNFEQRSYKEIEDDSNSDFARIYYTSELKELGPCPKNKSLTWLIINCFDKPRAKIAEVLAGQRKEEAEGIDLDAIDGWVSDKYVMKHHDYFEVVNFLFTLA